MYFSFTRSKAPAFLLVPKLRLWNVWHQTDGSNTGFGIQNLPGLNPLVKLINFFNNFPYNISFVLKQNSYASVFIKRVVI
jgi:hypothetical protein